MENKVVVYVCVLVVICQIIQTTSGSTLHIDKCDNYCGGSRLNPFGKSGSCKSCCLEKGFYSGGDCGDFLNRHCRCTQNPPGGTQPFAFPFNPQQQHG